ncbi:hypothetical protein M0657_000854 [Pyricularia oryzae]|nr:hypothetical protein OOU_Y34scaffold00745g89 [Pyricularia oryzae Y34]KAI7930419.1 hypothetical protein M9X92_000856 [Pyricularia oryzae]KAI7932129.1 hypothetical protein M0657_000854 [Pyricularia oryzae]
MKTTTIFHALSGLALMTTGTLAANCYIVKQWKPAKSTLTHAYYRAPGDTFHLHQHLCTSTERCKITCHNMDEKEWAVVGQFNEGGKEVPKVHGKDQWTVWDPKKRAQAILAQPELRDRFPETWASAAEVNKKLQQGRKLQ